MNIDIFLNQILSELRIFELFELFEFIYLNRNDIVIRFNVLKYYLPKAIIKYNNIVIHGKIFFEQAINSDIKKYEEIG